MAIKDGVILSRNSELLTGILGRQAVSFSSALGAVTQATRDQLNLQAGQERNFLDERRFLTTFDEDKFRDRRNFDRSVVVDERNFGENVRQFNVGDENTDLSRAQQRELTYAGLAREDARIGISRDSLGLQAMDTFSMIDSRESDRKELSASRTADLRLKNLQIDAFSVNSLQDQLKGGDMLDALEASGNYADEKVFKDLYPEGTESQRLAGLQVARNRVEELSALRRSEEELGELKTAATKYANEADRLRKAGDFPAADQAAAQSTAMFKIAGDTVGVARAGSIEDTTEKQFDNSLKEGDTTTRVNATKASALFSENQITAFGEGKSFNGEVQRAQSVNSREEFALDGEDMITFGGSNPDVTRQRRRALRREFYDLARRTTPVDARQAGVGSGSSVQGYIDAAKE